MINMEMINGQLLLTFILTAAATSAYILWFTLLHRRVQSGPTLYPIIGSLPSLFVNRHRFHDWVASNLRRTGERATYQTCTIAFPFLGYRQGFFTVTCHPRNLEHILKIRFNNYPKGPAWQGAFHDLLGQGIFNSDGESWLVQRKTAALEFTTRTLRTAMGRWVHRTIKNRFWPVLEKAAEEKASVDMQDLLLRLTFDNICGLTFGTDPETLSLSMPENPFATAFDTATSTTLQRILYPSFLWRLQKLLNIGSERQLAECLHIISTYMTSALEARKSRPSDDLLSRFIDKRDPHGNKFTNHALKLIALNFVLAGRDTSSVALTWFFWLLINNPQVESNIMAEISTVLKNTRPDQNPHKWRDQPLSFDEADKLDYMKAALAETLRLYPSVPQDIKYVVSDDILPDGTRVPAGSTMTYSIYSVGRMESIWGSDCMDFKPQRWLVPVTGATTGSGIGYPYQRFELPKDGYKFMAFNGGGPRTCLGKDLAYLQMKSVAWAVLIRYKLVADPNWPVEQKMSLTLFMKYGLRVYLEPRELAIDNDDVVAAD